MLRMLQNHLLHRSAYPAEDFAQARLGNSCPLILSIVEYRAVVLNRVVIRLAPDIECIL
jgi:hypothetical protein